MILFIEGPAQSGKSTMANALRNFAISNKRGALMIDDHADGAIAHHVEKIIDDGEMRPKDKLGRLTDPKGDVLKESFTVDEINWKADPIIVFVNSGAKRLDEIEALIPGFTKKLGPVNVVAISKGS